MQAKEIISLLRNNTFVFEKLFQGIDITQVKWRPEPEKWSILEIVNHLLDEEREDFRVRLDITLHDPNREWSPIDPEAWVTERKYNDRDPDESINKFLKEREASLEWLDSIGDVDWEKACKTSFGRMRAGDIFAAWVAHDQLHMRQMIELHRALIVERVKPYYVDYAGEW